MSAKLLFREKDDRFTPEALRLDAEISKVLEPIFKAWFKKGYSAREISHICTLTAVMEEGFLLLNSKNRA